MLVIRKHGIVERRVLTLDESVSKDLRQTVQIRRLAFPNDNDPPASFLQFTPVFFIAGDILLKLRFPEFNA